MSTRTIPIEIDGPHDGRTLSFDGGPSLIDLPIKLVAGSLAMLLDANIDQLEKEFTEMARRAVLHPNADCVSGRSQNDAWTLKQAIHTLTQIRQAVGSR